MAKIEFDYSKLRGKIVEQFGSSKAFAEELGVTESNVSMKLNNKTKLTTTEILKWASLLQINTDEIGNYFFVKKVQ